MNINENNRIKDLNQSVTNTNKAVETQSKTKKIPTIIIVIIIVVLGLGTGMSIGFVYFTQPKMIIQQSINKVFTTTENQIRQFELFFKDINLTDNFEITNQISLDTSVEDYKLFLDYSLINTTQVTSTQIYTNTNINYQENQILAIENIFYDGLLKVLFSSYDKIFYLNSKKINLEQILNREYIEEIMSTINTENILYINEFLNEKLSKSIDNDNLTTIKEQVIINSKTQNVKTYNYKMSGINTIIFLSTEIVKDDKMLEIIATLYDMTKEEIIKELTTIIETAIENEDDDLIIDINLYTSGLLKNIIGGKIEVDSDTLDFYLESETVFYEITAEYGEKLIGKINEFYIEASTESTYENITVKIESLEDKYTITITDLEYQIIISTIKENYNEYITSIQIDYEDHWYIIKNKTNINYDFITTTFPEKEELNIEDLDSTITLELLQSIIYSFINTPIGDLLIPMYEMYFSDLPPTI